MKSWGEFQCPNHTGAVHGGFLKHLYAGFSLTLSRTLRFDVYFSRWTWVSHLPPLILLLHLFLNSASYWDRPRPSMSFLIQSRQVFFGRTLCLIPSASHAMQCLTQSLSSFCSTLFLIIRLTGSNPKSSLEFFTFCLFSLTPHIHLIIIISAQFNFTSCCTFIGQVRLCSQHIRGSLVIFPQFQGL